MAIQFPRILKNMNLFVDGRGYAGRVDEIELPKLAMQSEEHRAGGMDAPVEIELGMEKLEATVTLSDHDPELFKLFGLVNHQSIPFTVRGSIQAQGSPAEPVVVQLRGGWKEIDPGTWKPGDKNVLKFAVGANYYKLSIGGQDLIEIDVINLVRVVGGKDQLADIRGHLGL